MPEPGQVLLLVLNKAPSDRVRFVLWPIQLRPLAVQKVLLRNPILTPHPVAAVIIIPTLSRAISRPCLSHSSHLRNEPNLITCHSYDCHLSNGLINWSHDCHIRQMYWHSFKVQAHHFTLAVCHPSPASRFPVRWCRSHRCFHPLHDSCHRTGGSSASLLMPGGLRWHVTAACSTFVHGLDMPCPTSPLRHPHCHQFSLHGRHDIHTCPISVLPFSYQ